GGLNVLAGSILYVQMDKRDLTRGGKKRYNEEEEAVISNLFSCFSGDDMTDVGRTVEGFGESWLSGAAVGEEEEAPEKQEEAPNSLTKDPIVLGPDFYGGMTKVEQDAVKEWFRGIINPNDKVGRLEMTCRQVSEAAQTKKWVSDEIVNTHFEQLRDEQLRASQDRGERTFVFNSVNIADTLNLKESEMEKRANKVLFGGDIFDYKGIVIPVNPLRQHWMFAHISVVLMDGTEKSESKESFLKVIWYDSMLKKDDKSRFDPANSDDTVPVDKVGTYLRDVWRRNTEVALEVVCAAVMKLGKGVKRDKGGTVNEEDLNALNDKVLQEFTKDKAECQRQARYLKDIKETVAFFTRRWMEMPENRKKKAEEVEVKNKEWRKEGQRIKGVFEPKRLMGLCLPTKLMKPNEVSELVYELPNVNNFATPKDYPVQEDNVSCALHLCNNATAIILGRKPRFHEEDVKDKVRGTIVLKLLKTAGLVKMEEVEKRVFNGLIVEYKDDMRADVEKNLETTRVTGTKVDATAKEEVLLSSQENSQHRELSTVDAKLENTSNNSNIPTPRRLTFKGCEVEANPLIEVGNTTICILQNLQMHMNLTRLNLQIKLGKQWQSTGALKTSIETREKSFLETKARYDAEKKKVQADKKSSNKAYNQMLLLSSPMASPDPQANKNGKHTKAEELYQQSLNNFNKMMETFEEAFKEKETQHNEDMKTLNTRLKETELNDKKLEEDITVILADLLRNLHTNIKGLQQHLKDRLNIIEENGQSESNLTFTAFGPIPEDSPPQIEWLEGSVTCKEVVETAESINDYIQAKVSRIYTVLNSVVAKTKGEDVLSIMDAERALVNALRVPPSDVVKGGEGGSKKKEKETKSNHQKEMLEKEQSIEDVLNMLCGHAKKPNEPAEFKQASLMKLKEESKTIRTTPKRGNAVKPDETFDVKQPSLKKQKKELVKQKVVKRKDPPNFEQLGEEEQCALFLAETEIQDLGSTLQDSTIRIQKLLLEDNGTYKIIGSSTTTK
ncbi:hypothetical protein TrRE_jg483, partial [Triparma retinervis]